MLGIGWMSLIEQIPQEQHDALGLVTSSGTMINIQTVMRLEEQYIVVRGRLTGSTDAGRTFFVPYDQIDCVYFQRFLKEDEVQAWFGGPVRPVSHFMEGSAEAEPVADGAPAPAVPPALGTPPAPVPPGPLAPQPTAPRGGIAAPLPAKAAILDRLRKRTAGPGPTPGSPPAK
jgi:hypothetical protein